MVLTDELSSYSRFMNRTVKEAPRGTAQLADTAREALLLGQHIAELVYTSSEFRYVTDGFLKIIQYNAEQIGNRNPLFVVVVFTENIQLRTNKCINIHDYK